MSRRVGLLLLLSGTPAGPMPDGATIGRSPDKACASGGEAGDIVVCGRSAAPSPRLPLREERAEPGEVVRSASDGPRGDPGRPGEPSRLLETVLKLAREAEGVLTGTDPD